MIDVIENRRGPGRPLKEEVKETVKKGKKSWSPSNLGDIIEKEAGYRYRRVRKDDENVSKKLEEGWEFVSGINSPKTKALHPDSRPDEPNNLTSNVEGRDWVAMRLDDETAKLRDDYHNDRTGRLEARIKSEARKEIGSSVHGSITKESKGIRTIIE
jgi:hypothetical protein